MAGLLAAGLLILFVFGRLPGAPRRRPQQQHPEIVRLIARG